MGHSPPGRGTSFVRARERQEGAMRIGNEIKGGRTQMSADASTHFHLALAPDRNKNKPPLLLSCL